jgi:uncharacterized protein (DUF1499 family)
MLGPLLGRGSLETPSRVATAAAGLGGVALVLFVGVPLGIWVGLFGPGAFRAFLPGVPLALLALLLGLFGMWWTRPSAHRLGRGRALLGAALGLLVLGTVVASQGRRLLLPPINDITTDIDDPPAFVAAPAATGADMAYDAQRFAAPTRSAYPDLETIQLDAPPARAFARIQNAARELGWEITHSDAEAGILEATETTRVFRFVDDVVVRVRPSGTGSAVDVRSRSRLGRGDLGANAARIRRLRDAIRR